MKILGQPNSINVRKVLWTCCELGIDYEREDWGGATRSPREPAFLERNPKGLVPVLVDGDFVLSESNSICRYLAATSERDDLLPRAPKPRALVEAWMDWQATELNNAWRAPFMGLVRRHPDYAEPRLQMEGADAWNRQMTLLDRQLDRTGAHVTGSDFTLADIVLALSANRWQLTPIAHAKLPAVTAWMERLTLRPGFRAFCANGTP